MIKKTPPPSQWSHHGPPIEKQPTNIIFYIFLHGHWTMIYYGFPTKLQWMIIQKYLELV